MGIEWEERRVLTHEVETDLPLSFLGFFEKSLYTITPSIAEDLFRMVEGTRYQSLNEH